MESWKQGVVFEAVGASQYPDLGSCYRLGRCSKTLREARLIIVDDGLLDLSTRLTQAQKRKFDDLGTTLRFRCLVASGLPRLTKVPTTCAAVTLIRCTKVIQGSLFSAFSPTLRRLVLRRCFLKDKREVFSELPTMPALEYLDIADNATTSEPSKKRPADDVALLALAAACPRLTALDVSGTFNGASAVGFQQFNLLRSLRALGCPWVDWTRVNLHVQDFAASRSHVSEFPIIDTLTDLDLPHFVFGGTTRTYRTRHQLFMEEAAPSFPEEEGKQDETGALRSLTLYGSRFASGSMFATFLMARMGPNLMVLNLGRVECPGFVDALRRCVRGLRNLRSLHLPGIVHRRGDLALTDGVLEALLPRDLRLLDVSDNIHLTPTGVAAAVRTSCPKLLVLRAQGLGPFADDNVTPGTLLCGHCVDVNGRTKKKKTNGGCCPTEETGARSMMRDAYHCLTCLFVGTKVLCAHCAQTCHADHDVFYAGRMIMFCDSLFLTPGLVPRKDR